ncbi:hypothetical protein [Acidisphaera sp. S103]|uniref:hypothetical protein n=1 Tax=Acidisphaera sp. S103 TaxID=1747223 RepID=UPI00131E7062|nr:hypothetical protein [Acidisphaera sp. S103]
MSLSPNSYYSGGGSHSSSLNGASHGQGGQGGHNSHGSNGHVGLALDNMLRNHLKVSNPRDARQIAEGLMSYYQDLPQAAGLRQELMGLPSLPPAAMLAQQPSLAAQSSSSDTEFRIANGDVEKALIDLASNPLTNDITPEMQGWGDSIRAAVIQGHAAARQGLDPTQRDKVIAVRRQLGEYARMARFVGSLSPGMTQNFRRLGRALDEVAAVLLVMLGESLASVGFATGYYLLQVPVPELQQRRDAVIYALRNFNGGSQQSVTPNDWPRGIDAYRRLYLWLEEQGQGDLRSLLLENEIAQTMDGLITRAHNGTSDGLRALGVTAQLDIERFRRMAIVAPGAMSREDGHFDRSPPLESYLQALELFAETFRPAGGLRLLRIARPPILLYGLYNMNQLEDDNSLFDLISVRGTLATIFDGLFPSNSARGVQPQVLLDMLLLELDRGIDLLALGSLTSEGGPTEWRAMAFWSIIDVIYKLVTGGSANFAGGPINEYAVPGSKLQADLAQIRADYATATMEVKGLDRAFTRYYQIPSTKVPPPLLDERQRRGLAEELRVQESLEERWENLVRTVSLEAGDQQYVFRLLKLVIRQAAYEANVGKLPRMAPALPQQYEQSLDIIARKV